LVDSAAGIFTFNAVTRANYRPTGTIFCENIK
jgi:hypothetical protein